MSSKLLSPSIVRKLWGGQKLELLKNISSIEGQGSIEPIGETWEVFLDHLPYLVKFIDTSEELSIQVHPGDEYARLHENSLGKTECWIILEAGMDAGIYLGLKAHVTKELLLEALKAKADISKLLNFYPVKKGDFFFVPAGSIHAIGKNVTLAEVQQNSGITYRVWDWNRVDHLGQSRELHVKKSLDVINFDPQANSKDFFQHKSDLFYNIGLSEICHHTHFDLFMFKESSGKNYKEALNLNRPLSLLNLSGNKLVNQIKLTPYCALIIEDESQLEIEFIEDGELLLIY